MTRDIDRVKTTITVSLGSKNRLRELKGSMSYEEYINQLLRQRNLSAHDLPKNYIELQKFERKKEVYSFEEYKIIFSYNKFNNSPHFVFDINLEQVRKNGMQIDTAEFIKSFDDFASGEIKIGVPNKTREYSFYFKLLEKIIQDEIEPLFRHNGRFEDHYSWNQEFKMLNISSKAYQEDVMEKLNRYQMKFGAFS